MTRLKHMIVLGLMAHLIAVPSVEALASDGCSEGTFQLSSGLVIASIVIDWATAYLSAREYNERHLGYFRIEPLNQSHRILRASHFGQTTFSRYALVPQGNRFSAALQTSTETLLLSQEQSMSRFSSQWFMARVEPVDQNYGKTSDSAKHQKSPATATLWSIGATLLPVGLGAMLAASDAEGIIQPGALLIAGGIILGPSAGHWYAGRTARGLLSSAIRLGLSVMAVSAALACDD